MMKASKLRTRCRYEATVRIEVAVKLVVMADDAREAAHRAASRALDSLEGIGEKARVTDHEIISTKIRPTL